MYLHNLEAILGGYSKIVIMSRELIIVAPEEYERWPSFAGMAMNILVVLSSPAIVIIAIEYIQSTPDGMTTLSRTFFQWIVLAWYWRLNKQNFWSILLLAAPIAYAGLRHCVTLMMCLTVISIAHFSRRH